MATVRDLISSALRKITVLGAGENMTAEDATDGLNSLNQMLDSWSADGQVIYSRSTDTLALTTGDLSYTMGPSGDINTARPVSITQATITQGGTIITPMNILGAETYSTLGFPSLQGIPENLYVNNSVPLLELKLYPVPISGLTLTIYSMKKLSDFALNDTVILPPGYERALVYNLAVEIAPEYEREASSTVKNIASDALSTIKRNNQQYPAPLMAVDPMLGQRYTNEGLWGFNIYGGA
jgi:hypothetical protein